MDTKHLDALGGEANKRLKHFLHLVKVWGKVVVFCITSFCAALSMLGISVSFVQILEKFMGINTYGVSYVKENLTDIGVALGSLGTCLALFYKLNFMKLAHKSFYEHSLCYCLFGWLFISIIYLSVVYLCTWCLSALFFYSSAVLAGICVIATPIGAHFRYRKLEQLHKEKKEQRQKEKEKEQQKEENESKNEDNENQNEKDMENSEINVKDKQYGNTTDNETDIDTDTEIEIRNDEDIIIDNTTSSGKTDTIKYESSKNKSNNGTARSSISSIFGGSKRNSETATGSGSNGLGIGTTRSRSGSMAKFQVDWGAFKHAFLDIFALLISAVSLSTCIVMIGISLYEMQSSIWTYDTSCRDNTEYKTYFTNILTAIFLMATSLSKLANHIHEFENGGTFQYILYTLVAVPCLYFSTVIAWSSSI